MFQLFTNQWISTIAFTLVTEALMSVIVTIKAHFKHQVITETNVFLIVMDLLVILTYLSLTLNMIYFIY